MRSVGTLKKGGGAVQFFRGCGGGVYYAIGFLLDALDALDAWAASLD